LYVVVSGWVCDGRRMNLLVSRGALMTVFLCIFEQALLDSQGLWSLSTPAPWRDLSWGVFLPLSFAANVVVAIFAWIIVGLIMAS